MTAGTTASTLYASGAVAQDASSDAARGDGTASAEAAGTRTAFDLPASAFPETQEPARLIVGAPLPESLAPRYRRLGSAPGNPAAAGCAMTGQGFDWRGGP